MVDKHGLNWLKIAQEMDMDDPMKIKNRYYSQIKKKNIYDELLEEGRAIEAGEVSPGAHNDDNNNNQSESNQNEEEIIQPIPMQIPETQQ